MLFFLTSRAISSTCAFAYPAYASYKTLAQRPASEPDLERWLMYWSVLGCLVGVEYIGALAIAWIPFYSFIRLAFLLYIAMPQTQGATILYSKKIQPFFHTHESEIDAALSSFRGRAYGWFQDLSRRMFGQVMGGLASQPADFTAASALATAAAMSTGAPPSMADPVSGPAALAGTLWRTFGPSVMASGAAAMRQTAAPGAPIGLNESARAPAPVPTTTTLLKPPVPPSHNISRLTEERRMPSESQSVIDRRRQLEAELAALGGPSGGFEGSPQITPASSVGPFSPSPFSPGPFSPGVWSRTSSSSTTDIPGGGDEAEVPSDIETENKASRRRN